MDNHPLRHARGFFRSSVLLLTFVTLLLPTVSFALTSAQKSALINYFEARGASSAEVSTLSAILNGGSSSVSSTNTSSVSAAPAVTNAPSVVATTQSSSQGALRLTRTLSLGSSGADVKTYQQFLIRKGMLPANCATGYYGTCTQGGTKSIQALCHIVSSGSPATTGWGVVGPQTRACIAQQSATSPTTTTSTNPVFLICTGTHCLKPSSAGFVVRAAAASVPYNVITATPNPCTIANGEESCTSSISWTIPAGVVEQMWVSAPGFADAQFICQAGGTETPNTVSGNADWITTQGDTFNLYQTTSCDPSEIIGESPIASTTVMAIANPPTITSVSPSSGTGGVVTITGTNFDSTYNENVVSIDGIDTVCTNISIPPYLYVAATSSGTQITCDLDTTSLQPGTYPVQVTNAITGLLSNTNQMYTVVASSSGGTGSSSGSGGGTGANNNASGCAASTASLVPLYQLYEPRTQKHFYTSSATEKSQFIMQMGYHDLGVVADIYDQQITGTVPLNRYKSTTSEDRIYSSTLTSAPAGYAFEKIEGYVYPTQAASAFPFYQYHLTTTQDHAYSIVDESAYFTSVGALSDGPQGYVCAAAPYISDDTVLAFSGATVDINGSGFGTTPDQTSYFVTFTNGSNTITIDSTNATVISWADNVIKLHTPPGVGSSYSVQVSAGTYGTSNQVPMRVYAYSSYPSVAPNDTGDGYSLSTPLDVALDAAGTPWIESEFSRGIEYFNSSTNQFTYVKDIQPSNPIFYVGPKAGLSPGVMSDTSVLNEDVNVDSVGNVWYGEGGDGYDQKGAARIVEYTPSTGAQLCYNVPLDGAGIVGLYLDESTGTMYAGADAPTAGDSVISFKPSTFSATQSSCTYNFTPPYPAPICSAGQTNGCFQRYLIPTLDTGAAHLAKGPDGNIYFTEYNLTDTPASKGYTPFGQQHTYTGKLAMLNPSTGVITEYPMPNWSQPVNYFGPGPWQIGFDSSGKLWFNEYFESAMVKFDPQMAKSTDCTKLDASGNNPCAVLTSPIYYPYDVDYTSDFIHSLDVDAQDRVWFTTIGPGIFNTNGNPGTGFIGMIDANGKMQMFPPLTDLSVQWGSAGIAVNNATGDIWLDEFWSQRIGLLKYVP